MALHRVKFSSPISIVFFTVHVKKERADSDVVVLRLVSHYHSSKSMIVGNKKVMTFHKMVNKGMKKYYVNDFFFASENFINFSFRLTIQMCKTDLHAKRELVGWLVGCCFFCYFT